jgi:hypothetical protein
MLAVLGWGNVGRPCLSVWRILPLVLKSLSFGVFPLRLAGGLGGVAAGTPDEVAVARA